MKLIISRILFFFFAVIGLVAWFAVFDVARTINRQDESASNGQECTEWLHESRESKFLDGPALAEFCQKYFAARTPRQAERDNQNWQSSLRDSQVEWSEFRKDRAH